MVSKRRKTGQTRMDAALDQMSTLGFSRQLVRKTVRDLLKIYGNDGWKLIEEDGYRVVLEVLLDEQEKAPTENLLKDAEDGASSEHEHTEKELVVAESNEVTAEGSSSMGNNNGSLPNYSGLENKESLESLGLDETALKSPSHSDDVHYPDEVNLQCAEDLLLSGPASDAAHTHDKVPRPRSKPCYGWISDDDNEEENYFIQLTPAT